MLTALVLVSGVVCLVLGVRTFGARGTRVGRVVLDFPDQVHGVTYAIREIHASGVPVRTVHMVKISVDAGDELEVRAAIDAELAR